MKKSFIIFIFLFFSATLCLANSAYQGLENKVKKNTISFFRGFFVDFDGENISYISVIEEFYGKIFKRTIDKEITYFDPHNIPVVGDSLWEHQTYYDVNRPCQIFSSSQLISDDMWNKLTFYYKGK